MVFWEPTLPTTVFAEIPNVNAKELPIELSLTYEYRECPKFS